MNWNSCDLRILHLRVRADADWQPRFLLRRQPHWENAPLVRLRLMPSPPRSPPAGYREQIMARGFYIGHHFGPPVQLRTSLRDITLYAADPDRIIWSYIVKQTLTSEALRQGYLHLKAAAVGWQGGAFLILGRGGSGKTELLQALCARGAVALCNTHALLRQGRVHGVQTRIRVRLRGRENYHDPADLLHGQVTDQALPLKGVLWYQYRTDATCQMERMRWSTAYQNARFFAEAVSNWELKEDLADLLGNDPAEFARVATRTDRRLTTMLQGVSAYSVSLDAYRNESCVRLLARLSMLADR